MKQTISLVLFLFILVISGCNTKTNVDLIVKNGKVYTVNPGFSISEAFAVKDGLIMSIGTTDEILSTYSSDSVLDLEGKVVYPGFIDAHCHFYGYGAGLQEADLSGTKSFEEVLERVKAHALVNKTKWIQGRGWDQNDWQVKEFPDKELLDAAFPDIPVILVRIDGHAALVNQKALDLAGITSDVRIPGGSMIIKNGKLTGLLIDNAIEKIKSVIPAPANNEIADALMLAQKNCFSVGLTSVQDAGLDKNVIETIKSLNNEGKLRMRIYAMITPSNENIETYLRKGIYKTDYLNIRSLKLYADGALVVMGEPVIFKLSPLSVIATLVTVPVAPDALCHIEPL